MQADVKEERLDMEHEQVEIKAGFGYYVFATFIVFALAAVSLIPAAMAYNVRTFTGEHISEWLSQAISSTILIAPTLAILAIGLTPVYAVTELTRAKRRHCAPSKRYWHNDTEDTGEYWHIRPRQFQRGER